MKSRLMGEEKGLRTFALLLEEGEDVIQSLSGFSREQDLICSGFSGCGNMSAMTLGCPDLNFQQYKKIPLGDDFQVVSMTGQIMQDETGPEVRARMVVEDKAGMACAGYLLGGHVLEPFEIVVVELPAHLQRTPEVVFRRPVACYV